MIACAAEMFEKRITRLASLAITRIALRLSSDMEARSVSGSRSTFEVKRVRNSSRMEDGSLPVGFIKPVMGWPFFTCSGGGLIAPKLHKQAVLDQQQKTTESMHDTNVDIACTSGDVQRSPLRAMSAEGK